MAHTQKNRLTIETETEVMQYLRLCTFRPNEFLYMPEHLMLIVEGSVVSKNTENQQRLGLILEIFDPGQFIGEAGLFGADELYHHYLSARSDVQVGVISYARFHKLLAGDLNHRSAEIMFVLAAQIAERLQRLQRNYINTFQMDVSGRIAVLLLDLARDRAITHPDGRQIKISRQEIGQMVGCSRETAGQVIKQFDRKNLISAKGKTLVIFGDY